MRTAIHLALFSADTIRVMPSVGARLAVRSSGDSSFGRVRSRLLLPAQRDSPNIHRRPWPGEGLIEVLIIALPFGVPLQVKRPSLFLGFLVSTSVLVPLGTPLFA
jgi:hypothetical protein